MLKELKEICNSHHITEVGVCDKGPFIDIKPHLYSRESYNTGFEEPDIMKRIDPSLTMDNVESIVVCLFPYHAHEVRGNLSVYTHSMDYHIVAKDILLDVAETYKGRYPDFEYQVYVDNGPLVDRHLAFKAGLGFFGVNTMLINPTYGSYFFIGYMLTNKKFPCDIPMDQTCYQCMACKKQCPGQVIDGKGNIDGRGCRSYITQKKELSDRDMEVLKKGKTIFGCDICQEVCPHNKDIPYTPILELKKDLLPNLRRDEIESLSNKGFKRQYGNRAFSWRGRKILLRNMDIIDNKQEDIHPGGKHD